MAIELSIAQSQPQFNLLIQEIVILSHRPSGKLKQHSPPTAKSIQRLPEKSECNNGNSKEKKSKSDGISV
jgi:hypothetical protein